MAAIFVQPICLILFLFVATSTLAEEYRRQTVFSVPRQFARNSQIDVQGSRSAECTSFEYTNDGQLRGCGYSLHIFVHTTLRHQHVSLRHYLHKNHLDALDQRAMRTAMFDIWSIEDFFFALETGTKRLFTAWGPKIQLRYVHSSIGATFFENIHPDRPPYTHECEPFCKLVKTGSIELFNKEHTHLNLHGFQNVSELDSLAPGKSVYEMSNDVSSSFLASQVGSLRTLNLEGCEDCKFGSIVKSCSALLATCLNNQDSCSRFSPQNDENSFFCKGLYYAYLKPGFAECPLEPSNEELYMYGICEFVKEEISKLSGGQEANVTGRLLDEDHSSDLPTSERILGRPIIVEVTHLENLPQKILNRIENAIKKGKLPGINKKDVDYSKMKRMAKCEEKQGGFKCRIDIYMNESPE